METIGKLLKGSRVRKRYSRARLEKATKIKKEFIEAIEKEEWEKLPEFPAVSGFVKNIAKTLKIDEKRALALLRRDYPPKDLRINPKPDVGKGFSWSPKLTFLVSVAIVSLAILGYLGLQYLSFISPPSLDVYTPKEDEVVSKVNLLVSGKTDTDATVSINNQPVLVEPDGDFAAEIEIFEGTEEILIKAVSRSGKETVVRRSIKPELKD